MSEARGVLVGGRGVGVFVGGPGVNVREGVNVGGGGCVGPWVFVGTGVASLKRLMRPELPPPPPPPPDPPEPPLPPALHPISNQVPLKSDGTVPKAEGRVVVVPPKSRYIAVTLFGGKV